MKGANNSLSGLRLIASPKANVLESRLLLRRFYATTRSTARACFAGNLKSASLQSVHQTGVDQEPVEAAGFRAVLAGVKHALAAQHDGLLLLERRIERDAGGFLDHQRQVRPVDRVHLGRTLDRFEVDRVDRIIG